MKNILINLRNLYSKIRRYGAFGTLTPEEFATLSQRILVPVTKISALDGGPDLESRPVKPEMISSDTVLKESENTCILAVIVVYERNLDEVSSWKILRSALLSADRVPPWLGHVLIYDNSAQPRSSPPLGTPRCSYVHNGANGGTAAAYTYATNCARSNQCNWMLLLDHDTDITSHFLSEARIATSADPSIRSVAWLPWVFDDNRPVSPAFITWAGGIRPLLGRSVNRTNWKLTGIASGVLIRTWAMNVLQPLLNESRLDFLDHRMFAHLRKQGLQLNILNTSLEHKLSVMRPGELSDWRLRSILDAEAHFIRELSWIARALYPARLLFRALRFLNKRPSHSITVLSYALRAWSYR